MHVPELSYPLLPLHPMLEANQMPHCKSPIEHLYCHLAKVYSGPYLWMRRSVICTERDVMLQGRGDSRKPANSATNGNVEDKMKRLIERCSFRIGLVPWIFEELRTTSQGCELSSLPKILLRLERDE